MGRMPRPRGEAWLNLPSTIRIAGVIGILLLCSSMVGSCTQNARPSASDTASITLPPGGPARPIDAVRAVFAALQDHAVAAIGESHNLKEAGDFYDSLVASQRVSSHVDDIVVEFGNSLYQSTIDRYVSGGSVPPSTLKKVWQDTTQVGAWDAPMYKAFFTAVRQANAASGTLGIRVLLGDPPIDWSRIRTSQQVHRYLVSREAFMAHVIV